MAQIVKVAANKVMRGDVIIHDGDVYTVQTHTFWSPDQTHICLPLCLAGSYSKKTIEVDQDFEFETLEL